MVVTVFYGDVVGIAGLDGERLVFRLASETEETASTALSLFDDLAVHFQRVAVVGHQRVFHITGEGGLVLTADTDGEGIATDTLGKAPGSEGGEVELVVIIGLHGLAFHRGIVPEFYLGALAVVEVAKVMDGRVLIVELTGLAVDDVGIGDSCLGCW